MSAASAPRHSHHELPHVGSRPRARRHLRVVVPAARRHPVLYLTLSLVIAMLLVLGVVSLNALTAGDAVQVRRLDRQVQAAERLHGQLVAEVAAQENPARIRKAAESAGMVLPQHPRFLVPPRPLPADSAPTAPREDALKPLLSADGR